MAGEWIQVAFSELCDITRGASPRPIHDWFADVGIPWVKISDANSAQSRYITKTGQYIKPEGLKKSVEVRPGDLILSNSATPGVPKFMGINACIHDGWLLLRNLRNLDKQFAYYLLLHERPKLVAQGNGSVFTNLKTEILKNHLVQLPPISEQRAIAHILGTLDDKIELNRKQNETLEAMARALFKAWFVDFEPVRAKMEGRWQRGLSLPGLPAHLYDLFPDRLVESELGEIPEGCEIEELGAHLDVLETGRRPKGGVGGVDKGVPSVGAESITGVGQFEFGKTKYVSEEFFAAMKSGHVESMDVLLYKDGGKPGDFKPRVSMFGRGFPFKRFAINEHVFRMRSRSLGQAFLYLQMSDERILFDLRNRGGKAAIPGINQVDVRTLLVIVPPRELLAAFDEAALPMMEGILDRAIEGRAIAQLRDTLLPKLISGELRIADAEAFLKGRGR